ncbi:MAG TPA: hypothetical protein VF974_04645 [Patescibacteria group bacterium]
MATIYPASLIARARKAFPGETQLVEFLEKGTGESAAERATEAFTSRLYDELDPREALKLLTTRKTAQLRKLLARLAEARAVMTEIHQLVKADLKASEQDH